MLNPFTRHHCYINLSLTIFLVPRFPWRCSGSRIDFEEHPPFFRVMNRAEKLLKDSVTWDNLWKQRATGMMYDSIHYREETAFVGPRSINFTGWFWIRKFLCPTVVWNTTEFPPIELHWLVQALASWFCRINLNNSRLFKYSAMEAYLDAGLSKL